MRFHIDGSAPLGQLLRRIRTLDVDTEGGITGHRRLCFRQRLHTAVYNRPQRLFRFLETGDKGLAIRSRS